MFFCSSQVLRATFQEALKEETWTYHNRLKALYLEEEDHNKFNTGDKLNITNS